MRALLDYMDENGITVTESKHIGYQIDDQGWEHHAFEVEVRNTQNGRVMVVTWRQGIAITDTPEDTPDAVFDSLIRDSWGFFCTQDFQDWCGDYGYEYDDPRALRTYQQVEAQAWELLDVLGGRHKLDEVANAYEPL